MTTILGGTTLHPLSTPSPLSTLQPRGHAGRGIQASALPDLLEHRHCGVQLGLRTGPVTQTVA